MWHCLLCSLLFWNLYIALLHVKPPWRGITLLHILPLRSFSCRSLGCQIVAPNSMLVKTFIWFHYKPACTSRLRPTPNMYFSHLIWHFAFVQHKASHSLMTPLRACVINIDLGEKRKKEEEEESGERSQEKVLRRWGFAQEIINTAKHASSHFVLRYWQPNELLIIYTSRWINIGCTGWTFGRRGKIGTRRSNSIGYQLMWFHYKLDWFEANLWAYFYQCFCFVGKIWQQQSCSQENI